ncbi:MAG: DEAD/DEAH box helicase family protein [Flavobacteriales bacterium]
MTAENNVSSLSVTYNSSSDDITKDFYEPCLKWAKTYDRGVGYFTSSWLAENSFGMSQFAANGGTARWITSPILSSQDAQAFQEAMDPEEKLSDLLSNDLEKIQEELEENTLNVLSWLIYDEILNFKFAIPTNELEEGEFHDKFGIFYGPDGKKISFNGSVNDSRKGTRNYESIKVFKSWEGMEFFVSEDIKRFERLWNDNDRNLNVHSLPSTVKNEFIKLRNTTEGRPYEDDSSSGILYQKSDKWRHQEKALNRFLDKKNGILEMATGTGKTRTAMKIIRRLLDQEKIETLVVTTKGTDLLNQWYEELNQNFELPIYRFYSSNKELNGFLLDREHSILLISKGFLPEATNRFDEDLYQNSMIVCDEIHNFGSPKMVEEMKGEIRPFNYRLGLSATPERRYDEEGNEFIKNEIGDVIYRFGLKEAIKRGILCEFDYYPLEYSLTQDEKEKIKSIIASFHAGKGNEDGLTKEQMYINIARVAKTSQAKIPVFQDFISENKELLKRCLIFVETKEYGLDLQEVLLEYTDDYHTFFGEDDEEHLHKFSQGQVNCLITAKRISEGIDVSSIKNIILFSVDRARLQTIQRIGRCLRTNPENPNKVASVVDFVRKDHLEGEPSAPDLKRKEWLEELSKVRREE